MRSSALTQEEQRRADQPGGPGGAGHRCGGYGAERQAAGVRDLESRGRGGVQVQRGLLEVRGYGQIAERPPKWSTTSGRIGICVSYRVGMPWVW